jgi:hypothetical protein
MTLLERRATQDALKEYEDSLRRFEAGVARRLVPPDVVTERRSHLERVICVLRRTLDEDREDREHDEA